MRKQYASTETFNILMLDKTINSSVKLSHKETIRKTRHKNPFWIGGKY